jgi:hypothetical protein
MTHRTDGELQAYLDAELDREAAAEVAGHLLACVDCRARLGELRSAHESLRQALGDFDANAGAIVPAVLRKARVARRTAVRAAILLLAVVGAAAAVVPGSPVRALLERRTVEEREPVVPVAVPDALPVEAPRTPGVASVTVAPLDGRVALEVIGFAEGSVVRVETVRRPDVMARLASGRAGVRFSVGPGRLEVLGSPDEGPGEVVIELPRGLKSATLNVNGREALVLSPGGLMRPGDPAGTAREGVVLRVEG